MRCAHTREVLTRVGVALPEGTRLVPYPAEKPAWRWALSFVRWGYCAWKSGTI